MSKPVQARSHFIPVNHRGGWLQVEVIDSDGRVGWGEASHSGDDERTRDLLDQALPALLSGLPDADGYERLSRQLPADKCGRTALSAIEMACTDLSCRQAGTSVAGLLTGLEPNQAIDIYCNLNRMCQDRSPATVAGAAQLACANGVTRLKFAPFDEVSVAGLSVPGADPWQLMQPGIRRLEALRDAAGQSASLMVDCHWRFTEGAMGALVRMANELAIDWIEDPFLEPVRADVVSLRAQTGALITGGEQLLTLAQFQQYAETSGVDVLIADVKHVGGIGALHDIAQVAAHHGMKFAPHNPSGPISTAASAHVVAANDNAILLEYPFGEVSWRGQLAPAEAVSSGKLSVRGPGIGVALDLSALPNHDAV